MKRGAPDILVDGLLCGLSVSDINSNSREIFGLKYSRTAIRPCYRVSNARFQGIQHRPADQGMFHLVRIILSWLRKAAESSFGRSVVVRRLLSFLNASVNGAARGMLTTSTG